MGAIDQIMALRLRFQLLIAAGIGAFGALGQAPFELWPASILSLALVFGLSRRASSWCRAGVLSWAVGTGYFMLALFWIVEPFFVDAVRHGWMAPFALFFLSFGLAVFWAAVGAVCRASGGNAGVFIASFVLVETVRTYALTGFPWAQVGHVLIDTAWLHLASWSGSLGLTALVLVMSVGVWSMLERHWVSTLALLSVSLALYAVSVVLVPRTHTPDDAAIVRLIQPNAPQHEKWDPDKVPIFFNRQLEFTAAERTAKAPDLIVWPETAVPIVLEKAEQTLDIIASAASGVPVVLGIQRFEDQRYYNSLVRLDENGSVSEVYDKHHLVPFGEYMPLGDLMGRFGIAGLAANDGGGYTPGPGPQVIDMGDLGTALPLICYEGVFPQDVGRYNERPDFLLLITNDAWFGEASGPYQHLAQARLRSAEQGLPMVRAANTGVSAMIDAVGRVTHSLTLGQAGWIDAPLPPALAPTLYARTGDLPVVLAALFLFSLSLGYNKMRPLNS